MADYTVNNCSIFRISTENKQQENTLLPYCVLNFTSLFAEQILVIKSEWTKEIIRDDNTQFLLEPQSHWDWAEVKMSSLHRR